MVNKETIGKIQLITGVIILIAAIVGFYTAQQLRNSLYDSPYKPDFNATFNDSSINNETKMILISISSQYYVNDIYFKGGRIIDLVLSSTIGLILSLLFITQGLVNIGERNGK